MGGLNVTFLGGFFNNVSHPLVQYWTGVLTLFAERFNVVNVALVAAETQTITRYVIAQGAREQLQFVFMPGVNDDQAC